MICKNCGKEIQNTSKFCTFCGTKVENISAEDVIEKTTETTENFVEETTNTSENSQNVETVYEPAPEHKGLSTGAIVAIVLGSVAAVVVLILLPILLLTGTGMYISHKATDDVLTRAQSVRTDFDNRQKEVYNSRIEQYTGSSVKGSEVIRLIEEIISSNASNVGVEGRFISIEVDDITGFSLEDELEDVCKAANINQNKRATNDSKKVNSATSVFNTLKSKIRSSGKYKVTVEYNEDGYIYNVEIEEL